MNHKHTPGPWRAGYLGKMYSALAIIGPNNEHIATCEPFMGHSARLIAAAPEMLKLLTDVYQRLQSTGNSDMEIARSIATVISKATAEPVAG